jgi:hypothetical protein
MPFVFTSTLSAALPPPPPPRPPPPPPPLPLPPPLTVRLQYPYPTLKSFSLWNAHSRFIYTYIMLKTSLHSSRHADELDMCSIKAAIYMEPPYNKLLDVMCDSYPRATPKCSHKWLGSWTSEDHSYNQDTSAYTYIGFLYKQQVYAKLFQEQISDNYCK